MASIALLEAFIPFFCFLVMFSYFLIKKHFDYLLIKKAFQSYPWNWPVLGMLPGLLVRMNQIYDVVEVFEKSNLTFAFKGPWFTGMDFLVTVDPTNIHHIMSINFSNYIKGPNFQEIFEVYGDGIFNVDSEQWSVQRKCYQAVLHGSKDVFQRFMFDIILISGTGTDPQTLSTSMPTEEFSETLKDVEETIFYRHLLPRFLWKLQYRMGLGQEKKMIQADATFDRLCKKYISAKRNEIQKGLNHNSNNGEEEEVLLGFFLAGKDTIASTLTWFFWLLSKNPQVVAKIHQEINTNLPRSNSSDQEWPSYDHTKLDKLVYLHGALFESMRLYPPAPLERKSAIKSDVLPSGHKVHADSMIMFFIFAMGRIKEIWGEDALEFKPERWISATGRLRHEPSYKFFTFNAGPRTCLGKYIATSQLKTVVVEILQNYDIEVLEEQKIEPELGLVLHMKHGLRATINKKC